MKTNEPHSETIERLLAQRDWLHGLARQLVTDAGLAEDLVQETWIRALRRPPRSLDSLRAWLRRVIVNLAAQSARSNTARTRREERRAHLAPTPASTAEVVARVQMQRRLCAAVLELDEPYRDVLLLRFFEQLDTGDIARRLGSTPSTIRGRQQRGLERLRRSLEHRYGKEPESWLAALAPVLATGATATELAADAPSRPRHRRAQRDRNAGPRGPRRDGWVSAMRIVAAGTAVVSLLAVILLRTAEESPVDPPPDSVLLQAADDGNAGAAADAAYADAQAPIAPADTLPIAASADAVPTTIAPPETSSRTIVRVLIDGAPATGGGRVIIDPDGRWIPEDPRRSDATLLCAQLGPDGTATFEDLDIEHGRIGVDLGGPAILQKTLRTRPGSATEVIFKLGTARIEGIVYRSPTVPANDAILILGVQEGWNYAALSARVALGSDGRFELDRLPAGSFWLHAEMPQGDTGPTELRSHGTLGEGEFRAVTLGQSSLRVEIRGTLRDRTGRTVSTGAGGGLEFIQESGEQIEVEPVDLEPDGTFRLELAPGLYTVRARLIEHERAVLLAGTRSIDASTRELTLTLPGTRISGSAYDAATGTIADASALADLRLLPLEGRGSYSAAIRDDGSFVFSGVAAGEYEFAAGDARMTAGGIVSIDALDLEVRVDVWLSEQSGR